MSLAKLTALLFLIAVLFVPVSVRAQNAEQGAQQQLIAADRGLLEAMAGRSLTWKSMTRLLLRITSVWGSALSTRARRT
jgi:hypothetical protein